MTAEPWLSIRVSAGTRVRLRGAGEGVGPSRRCSKINREAGEGVGPRSTFSFWSTKCLDESRTSVDPIDGFKSLGKCHGHHVNLLWPLHEFLIFIGTFQHVSHK